MRCIVCEEPLERAFFGELGGIKVSLCEKHFEECSECKNRKSCGMHDKMRKHERD
jgi:positive regulator of sigma E activity